VAATAAWVDNNRGAFGPLASVAGVLAGVVIPLPGALWMRGVAGAALGLLVWWLVPTLWACGEALAAPYHQRTEARAYARAVEGQVVKYSQWARRRRIAEGFRDEALGLADVIEHQLTFMDIPTLTDDWRTRVRNVVAQLEANGGSAGIAEMENQLRALDAGEDDGYGNDEVARLRNRMRTAGGNLWTVVRSEEQPTSPPHPTGVASG